MRLCCKYRLMTLLATFGKKKKTEFLEIRSHYESEGHTPSSLSSYIIIVVVVVVFQGLGLLACSGSELIF
jgi:hypothetical protein